MKLEEIKNLIEMTIDANGDIPDLTDEEVTGLTGYFADGKTVDKIERDFVVVENGDDYGLTTVGGELVGWMSSVKVKIQGTEYLSIKKIQIRKKFSGKNLAKAFIFWLKELKEVDVLLSGILFNGGQALIKKLATDRRFDLKWIDLDSGVVTDVTDIDDQKYRKSKRFGIITEGHPPINVKPWTMTLPGSDERFYFQLFTLEEE